MPLFRQFLPVEQVAQRFPAFDRAVAKGQIRLLGSCLLRQFLAQGAAGQIDRRSDRGRTPASARAGPTREIGIAQLHEHIVHCEAQHLTHHLCDDRVGAGANIGHVGAHFGSPVGPQRDPRPRLADIVNARRARHTGADPPFAFARLARFARAGIPAELFCALLQALGQLVRGKRQILFGIAVGNVADTQFDRIDAGLFRQHVHRDFQRRHADSLAWRTDRSRGHAMDARDFEFQRAVLSPVKKMRGLQHRLREVFFGKVGD